MWRPDLPQPPSQPPVESITHGALVLALIVSGRFREPGIHFFTPPDFSQQLGYMEHPAGKLIEPHLHNPVLRELYAKLGGGAGCTAPDPRQALAHCETAGSRGEMVTGS
jgi:hypothetical protein